MAGATLGLSLLGELPPELYYEPAQYSRLSRIWLTPSLGGAHSVDSLCCSNCGPSVLAYYHCCVDRSLQSCHRALCFSCWHSSAVRSRVPGVPGAASSWTLDSIVPFFSPPVNRGPCPSLVSHAAAVVVDAETQVSSEAPDLSCIVVPTVLVHLHAASVQNYRDVLASLADDSVLLHGRGFYPIDVSVPVDCDLDALDALVEGCSDLVSDIRADRLVIVISSEWLPETETHSIGSCLLTDYNLLKRVLSPLLSAAREMPLGLGEGLRAMPIVFLHSSSVSSTAWNDILLTT